MCGIVGVLRHDGASVDRAQLERLRDTMAHRGPDDAGVWSNPAGDVGLAHRRLAIVDLSDAGHAPMSNEDGSVWVTFNGEIYNHEELRAELEQRGHVFRSHCDTEVLVHLYEELGPRMVERLVGMFALVVWDEARGRLLAARDRLGIKPLYWINDGERFAFASEIKALLPLLRRQQLNEAALAHYLTFVAVPAPETLFADVYKLAPATTLVLTRGGQPHVERYWDPIEHRAQFDGAEPEWTEEIMFRLRRSVRRRMMSDVPVGAFLSGGVDSSTNVALMSELSDEPVNTFSIGFEEGGAFNEFRWAREIAERYGTNHRETLIRADDLWEFLPQLVFHQDEPIADPVCVPLYFVSKLAKEHGVTVVHVGEGADELFAGYPTYVTAHQRVTREWPTLRRLPRPARRVLAGAGAGLLPLRPGLEIHAEALGRAAEDDSHLWWGGAVAFYERGLRRITGGRLAATSRAPRDVVAEIAADATRAGARDDLDRLIYQDLRLRLPELLLMRVDKLTMATAVEARVPFLDHELVELAMSVPAEEKIRDGLGKHVLKRAVSDLLPEHIVWRPKQGFGAPVADWFRGPLGDLLERQISGSAIHDLGIFDRDALQQLQAVHRSGRADRSFQLWNVLNLSVWFDHWIAGRDPI
jgi:asparagine synthase (glutamine-hydrolysing)